jgi:hypothetical protein
MKTNLSNRRTFLRTTAGIIALPWMESITGAAEPVKASLATAKPPQRFVAMFFPNGVYPTAWQSQSTPAGLKFGGVGFAGAALGLRGFLEFGHGCFLQRFEMGS